MAKKKTDKAEQPSASAASTAATPAPQPESEAPARSQRAPRATAKPTATRVTPDSIEPPLQAILAEIRTVKEILQPPPPTQGTRAAAVNDAALESSVDSLRRLLSELIEQHMESVVRDLAHIRLDAAAIATRDGRGLLERLDDMLERLGAIRFEAEPMDVVDPLIHAVVEERRQADAPEGVILGTVRPGFRTPRGLIACKAAVAINRRA